MPQQEKRVMALLYQAVKHCPSQLLGSAIHQLIHDAGEHPDEHTKMLIYEQRLYAETMITRPVMKGFKSMIREHGLFNIST